MILILYNDPEDRGETQMELLNFLTSSYDVSTAAPLSDQNSIASVVQDASSTDGSFAETLSLIAGDSGLEQNPSLADSDINAIAVELAGSHAEVPAIPDDLATISLSTFQALPNTSIEIAAIHPTGPANSQLSVLPPSDVAEVPLNSEAQEILSGVGRISDAVNSVLIGTSIAASPSTAPPFPGDVTETSDNHSLGTLIQLVAIGESGTTEPDLLQIEGLITTPALIPVSETPLDSTSADSAVMQVIVSSHEDAVVLAENQTDEFEPAIVQVPFDTAATAEANEVQKKAYSALANE